MNRWVWIGLFSVWSFRSSRPEVFCTKGVLKHFANFTGKHLRQSLFFNKAADLRPATLLKNRPWHRCFSVNFAKFLRTPFFTEHLQCLLLKFISHHIKEMLYVNINLMGNKPWSKYIFSCFWYWCWKNLLFSVKLKLLRNKC